MSTTLAMYPPGLSADQALWFAILTRVKAEKKVAGLLAEKKINAYVPLQKKVRLYSRKRKTVLLPLIYRYVFVQIKAIDYVNVLETPHVEGFVRFDKNLVPIPEREIEWLQRVTGEQMDFTLETRSLTVGDQVKVIYGNLTGLQGKLVKTLGKNELLIELDHIGIGLRIQIDPSYLQPVS
jgi:transcriptional antiterminator RfaH